MQSTNSYYIMKQILRYTLAILSVAILLGCEKSLTDIPVPPKDATEYISPLEDGNTWVFGLGPKHVITEIIGEDTIISERNMYMTQIIQGDSLFNGKICKKLYYYFHYNPTVGEGDTVYTEEKFPRIFPGAFYICTDAEGMHHKNYENYPDDDIYIGFASYLYYGYYDIPILLHEENFVISEFVSVAYDTTIYETPIISLNLAKGDVFHRFEVTNVSSITLCDGKSRRVMEIIADRVTFPDKTYHTYWIEGIGCIVNGINLFESTVKPSIVIKLISFSTNGREIYTGVEGDFTASGMFFNYASNFYTTEIR